MKPNDLFLAGTANVPLAQSIVGLLGSSLGNCHIERFPDGEVSVEVMESVRGKDVFLIQPTSAPVNDRLMELLALADACRRAAAARITAIVPYFGYARADKRSGRRAPVTARAVADLLEAAGINHVVTVDAHTPQLEGFFHIPIDDLSATDVLCDAQRDVLLPNTVIVSPDLGGLRRAVKFAERLGTTTAVCAKRRLDGSRVMVTQVIGDVRERRCCIVDDMITTGGTIAEAAKALRDAGAREPITAAATHGVLVAGARERLTGAGIQQITVTDSIDVPAGWDPPLRIATVAPKLAEVIRRLSAGESLRDLY
ncbi:MAG: ribose-phosphate diphosphokinase [Gemmatimonadota bacterium]